MITVNFQGFREIVDDVGGVFMDVDHRYFNDNAGLGYGQTYDRIDLHPGYQRLTGVQALDYVRFRHTDSDLYRNARQQEFVKAFKQQVSSFSSVTRSRRSSARSPSTSRSAWEAGRPSISARSTATPGSSTAELPGGAFQQSRLEGLTDVPGTYLLQASPESVDAAVDKFLHPDPAAADKAAAAATGTKPKTEEPTGPPPSEVSVEVLNGNGVAGSADEAAYVLGQRGYVSANGGNADRFDYFETTVLYTPGAPTPSSRPTSSPSSSSTRRSRRRRPTCPSRRPSA